MDRPKLNLYDVGTARERELLDLVRDTEFDRVLGGKVDVPESPLSKHSVVQRTPLAQDVFRSVILRESGVH